MNAQVGIGYGQALGGQGNSASFSGSQQFAQVETASAISILESHLAGLKALSTGLYGALERATKIADRLMGQEPQTIPGGGNGAKDAVEPPVSRKLASAQDDLSRLNEMLHQQLSRLERL